MATAKKFEGAPYSILIEDYREGNIVIVERDGEDLKIYVEDANGHHASGRISVDLLREYLFGETRGGSFLLALHG